MKIYLATWILETSQGVALTKKHARSRLMSYHFLNEQGITSSQLNEYYSTGKLNISKK